MQLDCLVGSSCEKDRVDQEKRLSDLPLSVIFSNGRTGFVPQQSHNGRKQRRNLQVILSSNVRNSRSTTFPAAISLEISLGLSNQYSETKTCASMTQVARHGVDQRRVPSSPWSKICLRGE